MKNYLFLIVLLLFTNGIYADKKALIISISTFKDGFSEISSQNDQFLLTKTLKQQGFNSIISLAEKAATKKKILSTLNEFAKQLKSGDIAFIHFSTHGRQVQDFNQDEIDGLDEAIVCYDSKMEGDQDIKTVISTYLVDDTLERVVNSIRQRLGKSGDLIISLDACHSGTGTRGDGIKRGGYVALVDNSFKVHNPVKQEQILADMPDEKLASYVVFTGSQADVCNYEVSLPLSVRSILPNQNGGAGSLTYALCTAFNSLDANAGKYTYQKIFEDVKINMSELEKVQVPTIEGNGIQRELFGGKFVAQKKYFVIDSINGKTITLKAGTPSGFYNGTKVVICKSGTIAPSASTIIGRATVVKENYFKSKLDIDSGSVIPRNAWIFIEQVAFKENTITIHTGAISPLAKQFLLKDLPFLQETKDGEIAEIKIVNDTKSQEINYDLLLTKNNTSICYNPAIVDINPDNVKGYENLKNYLTDYYQYKNISSINIKNKDYKVEFEVLLLKNGDTCRTCTDARRENGNLVLYEGDTIKFLLKNKGTKLAFFNILDLQPDGRIGLVFTGEAQQLKSTDLFIKDKEAVKLFPTNNNNTIVIGPPYGVDLFKLICFSYPEDLSNLQVNYNARGEVSKGLGALLRNTNKIHSRGSDNKINVSSQNSAEEDGATFELSYEIKPRPAQ